MRVIRESSPVVPARKKTETGPTCRGPCIPSNPRQLFRRNRSMPRDRENNAVTGINKRVNRGKGIFHFPIYIVKALGKAEVRKIWLSISRSIVKVLLLTSFLAEFSTVCLDPPAGYISIPCLRSGSLDNRPTIQLWCERNGTVLPWDLPQSVLTAIQAWRIAGFTLCEGNQKYAFPFGRKVYTQFSALIQMLGLSKICIC